MYLRRLRIEQFRSIESLEWKLPKGARGPGWHVILGENGSGKSSVLRAVALSLIGPEQSSGLQVNWNQWVRFGQSHSRVRATLGRTRAEREFDVRVVRKPFPSVVASKRGDRSWSKKGPFAASFGPFRRFSGGDARFDELLESGVPFSAHLSLFNESVSLGSATTWLKSLRPVGSTGRRQYPSFAVGWGLVSRITDFLNQEGFLPSGVRLEEVDQDRVVFRDGRGARVEVEQLSDGFRSILSLVFELLRRAVLHSGSQKVFDQKSKQVTVPGIVCIDEADAHLHPTWQRVIGPWLCRMFPKVQFLVTTHSPFVCQASEGGGSVFQLMANGESRFVEGIELQRLRLGNVLEAYGTQAFGTLETRSESGKTLIRELAELNIKTLSGKLTPPERSRQKTLQSLLPTGG
ncbi:MAG: AAA family ATPase [Myxococcaceae bacterium]